MNTDAFEGSETVAALPDPIWRDGDDKVVMPERADVYCPECSQRNGVTTVHSPESHAVARQIEQQRQTMMDAIRTKQPTIHPEVLAMQMRRPVGMAEVLDAEVQDTRLKRCGLVFHENQLDGHRWVSPPAGRDATDQARIKVLPLFMVTPTPELEITATDGEKYLLPAGFEGDWFDCVSPKGVRLIAL